MPDSQWDHWFTQAPPSPPAPSLQAIDTRDEAAAQDLHDQLEPLARKEYLQYMLSRTPVYLQEYMKSLIEADFTPEPPDPNSVLVTNGQRIDVVQQNGSVYPGEQGTIKVSGGVLQSVEKVMASSTTFVTNGQQIPVLSSAGVEVAGSPGNAMVVGGAMNQVRLTV